MGLAAHCHCKPSGSGGEQLSTSWLHCYFRFIIWMDVSLQLVYFLKLLATSVLCVIRVIFPPPNWSTRLGGNSRISAGKWLVLVLTPLPLSADTHIHRHTRPCETCSSSGQMMTDSHLHAASHHLPQHPRALSRLCLSLSLPLSFVHSECLHLASLAWPFGGLLDKGRGGVSEGSKVNRKSGGSCCVRKGRVEHRSMWECCQPQVHSRSEFKTFSFYSFLSFHPFHRGLNGFEYFWNYRVGDYLLSGQMWTHFFRGKVVLCECYWN